MRNLTLLDLSLGLKDLLTTRRADLDSSAIGKEYAPQLTTRLVQIENVAEHKKERANATELSGADSNYDGFGQGIWFYTGAVLVTPSMSDAARGAALRVREAFVPERSVLANTYAEEAGHAKKNRPKVAELENDLKSLPVPDGKTLFDWVNGFLDAGDSLDKLLSDRSTAEASPTGTSPAALRATTIGILGRLREALRDEVATNDALARDLEQRIFAYIDELSDRRARKETKKPE